MGVADDIIAARDCGVVHCGLSSHITPSVADVAAEFGLASDPKSYKEIDADSARRLVELILNQDLAYDVEIVPAAHAAALADQFLAQFGTDGVRFFTNGTFHKAQGPSSRVSWDPVTAATFDTGVLVIVVCSLRPVPLAALVPALDEGGQAPHEERIEGIGDEGRTDDRRANRRHFTGSRERRKEAG